MDVDGIKAALLGAMLSGCDSDDENMADQAKCKALKKTFDNEADALEYARRLAQLRPGDRIRTIKQDNSGYRDAIFVRMTDKTTIEFLWYDPEDKQIWAGKTNLFVVQLP